ncbi:MAG: acyloxyacyl hydrolase [Candidatus Binatia bacterium]
MRTTNHYFFPACFALLALLLLTTPAQSAPVGGDNEAEVAAGFFHAQGSDTGSFNVDLQFGRYLTPGWELGIRQALNYNFIDDGRDAWVASTVPFLLYNFHFNDRVIPFLGAGLGAAYNDDDITGTLAPQAGVKIFLTDQTYLGLRYRYEWFFNSFKRADNEAAHGNHVATIGIGFVWGGTR